MDFMKGNLTYKAWIPFDYTPPIIFFFVYIHQMIGMAFCAAVNVACDSLVAGLLQQICCQLEILEYRLTKILYDQHILRDCVRHHDRIYELVFTTILLFQKFEIALSHVKLFNCLYVRFFFRNLKIVQFLFKNSSKIIKSFIWQKTKQTKMS